MIKQKSKKAIQYAFFSIMLLFSVSCEDLIIEEKVGCLSGVFPGSNNRVYIFCMSRTEYASLVGNTFNGVTYDNVIWTEVSNCDECLTIDYSQL